MDVCCSFEYGVLIVADLEVGTLNTSGLSSKEHTEYIRLSNLYNNFINTAKLYSFQYFNEEVFQEFYLILQERIY